MISTLCRERGDKEPDSDGVENRLSLSGWGPVTEDPPKETSGNFGFRASFSSPSTHIKCERDPPLDPLIDRAPPHRLSWVLLRAVVTTSTMSEEQRAAAYVCLHFPLWEFPRCDPFPGRSLLISGTQIGHRACQCHQAPFLIVADLLVFVWGQSRPTFKPKPPSAPSTFTSGRATTG